MEVVVVVPPGTHLAEPGTNLAGLLAEHLLDCRVHEDACDLRIGCGPLDQLRVQRRPDVGIDGEGILEHRGCGDVLALLRRENAVGHGREPDVGVKPI